MKSYSKNNENPDRAAGMAKGQCEALGSNPGTTRGKKSYRSTVVTSGLSACQWTDSSMLTRMEGSDQTPVRVGSSHKIEAGP